MYKKNDLPFSSILKNSLASTTLENLLAYQKQLAQVEPKAIVEEGIKQVIEKELNYYTLAVEIFNLPSWKFNLLIFILLIISVYFYLLILPVLVLGLIKLFVEMFVEKTFWQ